eukprot:TRINITY_DN44502_c0_g1_i1.p1 TRINITY_DN44502_c0_g1~~TRINITY_DN44502_c0_g1_i1.p1  ORF type:complete len:1372 (-),score=277.45 TRINITY_DN44502_c0_g1_i1:49-4164(-)
MTHPARALLRGRGPAGEDEDESFEALLREQASFGRGGGGAPAATAVRVPRKAAGDAGLGASEDGDQGKMSAPSGKPSLFKALRQGLAAGGGAAAMAGRPFGARAAAPHPEISALPELEGPDKEDLPCMADSVKERSPNKEAVGEHKFPSMACGFPIPHHRAVGKHFGKSVSSGKKRETLLDLEDEEEPQNEEDAIDLENRKTLARASAEEVQEWQQQFLQQFGKDTCEFFRKRGQEKLQRRAQAAAPTDTTEAMPPTASTGSTAPASSTKAELEARIKGLGLTFDASSSVVSDDSGIKATKLAGSVFDRAELQKLQWTTPSGQTDIEKVVTDESLPPEPAAKLLQLLRFDFEGRICLRKNDDEIDDNYEGLHHHGAESSQAGYTLAELLLLSRSTSAPQRALALATLAAVLNRSLVPASRDALSPDPALREAGQLTKGAEPGKEVADLNGLDDLPAEANALKHRSGFGMGLPVLFWHGLARSDIPKHLAEGLRDTSLPVQMAALRGVVAMLDGDASSETVGDIIHALDTKTAALKALPTLDATICRPWEAGRSLVWTRSPPGCCCDLALRARVTVLTSEGQGGSGGGQSTWPQLLRSRLLGAKKEPEVTAADVLEPLLPHPPETEEDEQTYGGPPAIVTCSKCCMAAATKAGDRALMALVAQALASACIWSAHLCRRVLDGSLSYRCRWLRAASEPESTGAEVPWLRLEALRFIRRSCEVGGRAAVSWWLADSREEEQESAAKMEDIWTAVVAVRKAVLPVLESGEVLSDDLETLLCAIEGVRIWLAWLRCGAGCDRLESFVSSIGIYFQKLALISSHKGKRHECHYMFGANLLELTLELLRVQNMSLDPLPGLVGPTAGDGAAAFAIDAAEALSRQLASCSSASAAQQVCLAALAELLEFAIAVVSTLPPRSSSDLGKVAKALVRAQVLAGTDLPEAETDIDDMEAPWPLGGHANGMRAADLARIRAVSSLCRLAGQLQDSKTLTWLEAIRDKSARAVACLIPQIPRAVDVEALAGTVQHDSWARLFADACQACTACATPSEQPSETLLGSALRLAGTWPTTEALLASRGLTPEDDARKAMLRAAFRPSAPWAPVRDDAIGRTTRAMGQQRPEPVNWALSLPEGLGPARLAFAAAPFWALMSSPPRAATASLLEFLGRGGASCLALAAPPWLPFLAFASVLSVPLGFDATCRDEDSSPEGLYWAWKDARLRELLEAYAAEHFKRKEPTWLHDMSDWLGEALRGLCDRLAKVFVEESFGDSIVARALWAFAAPAMPPECRAVCWGREEPAVLALLRRSLSLRPDDSTASELFWPLAAYLEPPEDQDKLPPGLVGVTARDWPTQIALHHLALQNFQPSPLLKPPADDLNALE